jgi:hypothetical protein
MPSTTAPAPGRTSARTLDRRLSSAGLGLRMALTEHAEFQLESVRRFTRSPSGAQADELKADALFWRVLFRY